MIKINPTSRAKVTHRLINKALELPINTSSKKTLQEMTQISNQITPEYSKSIEGLNIFEKVYNVAKAVYGTDVALFTLFCRKNNSFDDLMHIFNTAKNIIKTKRFESCKYIPPIAKNAIN